MGNSPVNRGVSRISDQSIPSKRTAVNSLVDQISDAKLPNLLIYKDAGTQTSNKWVIFGNIFGSGKSRNRFNSKLLTSNPEYRSNMNLKDLSQFQLQGWGRNINITTSDNEVLHGWHILPPKMNISSLQSTDFDEMLAHSSRIILYFHGNSGNRGVKYRVDFVKTLATQYDAHVITFDYRGFGDSTGWPISEEDTTTDAFAVLNWVESVLCKHGNGLSYLGCGNSIGGRTSDQCHKDKKLPFLYFYGHSLGSAVGVALAHKLKDSVPGIITGLILDSPFTNFPDAALVHPVGAIFRIFPWVKSQINTSLMFRYPTIDRIHQLDTNIMFVHGTADKKVPITFSEQLYRKIMVNAYNSNKKQYNVVFSPSIGASHNDVYKTVEWLINMEKFLKTNEETFCFNHN